MSHAALTLIFTLNNARAVKSTARPVVRFGEKLHTPFAGTGRRLGGGGQVNPEHSIEREAMGDAAPQSLSRRLKIDMLWKGDSCVCRRQRVDKVHPPKNIIERPSRIQKEHTAGTRLKWWTTSNILLRINNVTGSPASSREQRLPPLGGQLSPNDDRYFAGKRCTKPTALRVRVAPTILQMEFRMDYQVTPDLTWTCSPPFSVALAPVALAYGSCWTKLP